MSLNNFHEVSFPVPLALAASGGPERKTEVVTLASGAEARNALWAGSRRRWDVGSAVTRLDTLQAVVAFFEARGGRLNGFRFRDALDDRSCAPGAAVSATDQEIGTGDGVTDTFQLVKAYGGYARRILKPASPHCLRCSIRIDPSGRVATSMVHLGALVMFSETVSAWSGVTCAAARATGR